jgi:hypothetical protein
VVGAVFGAAIAACTARDSLFDRAPAPGAGTGGSSEQGGASGGGEPSAGSPSSGGAAGRGGGSVGGTSGKAGVGGSTGGSGGATGGSGGSSGGSGGATGGSSPAGSAGAGGTGGDSGAGGAEQCPPGEIWCPGCTPGTGQCGVGCTGAACFPCAELATFEECEARPECHSVFDDPGTCGCATVGCCAEFSFCADGAEADCTGGNVSCDALRPFCDNPAYVNSYSGFCYEGCVDPKDCAPVCTLPDDATGCLCYSDADCPTQDTHCYSADCGKEAPGTCREPPASGCFGDVDCPEGQTCIGGRPAPCGSTQPDVPGTCGVEECPTGDCPGSNGPSCTCSDGTACVVATGPAGSGWCRNDDGTCSACKCAAPDTPVATPTGERAIADLRPGDLVYSVDGDAVRAVPIVRINRTPVVNHRVLHVTFAHGRSIDMTAGHPLADGRPLSALRPGSELMGGVVVSVATVPYAHDATYDILPRSTSGAYFASGVLIGSTLATPTRTSLSPEQGLAK